MNARLVIFDLDGTLIDSSAWLLRAVNRVIAPYTARPWTLHDLLATAGGPEREALRGTVPESALPGVLDAYRKALREAGSLQVQPGIPDVLAALEARNVPMALFSGAGRALGELRLSLVGWGNRFPVRVWGDDTAAKPAPDGLYLCAERAGIPLAESVFVGDTEKDSLCARVAGVRFVGVGWGDRGGVIEGCDTLADSPGHLLDLL